MFPLDDSSISVARQVFFTGLLCNEDGPPGRSGTPRGRAVQRVEKAETQARKTLKGSSEGLEFAS